MSYPNGTTGDHPYLVGDDSPDPPAPAPRIEGRKASRRYACPTCGGDLDVACDLCPAKQVSDQEAA